MKSNFEIGSEHDGDGNGNGNGPDCCRMDISWEDGQVSSITRENDMRQSVVIVNEFMRKHDKDGAVQKMAEKEIRVERR